MKKIFLLLLGLLLHKNYLPAMEAARPEIISNVSTANIKMDDFEMEFRYPLHKATYNGNVKECLRLLNAGLDLNEKWQNKTPLRIAFEYSKFECFKLLLSHGAEIEEQMFFAEPKTQNTEDIKNKNLIKSLLIICHRLLCSISNPDELNNSEIIEMITKLGNCINFSLNGIRPLTAAIFQQLYFNRPRWDIINALIFNGADLRLCDSSGMNALAVFFTFVTENNFGPNFQIFRLLFQNRKTLAALSFNKKSERSAFKMAQYRCQEMPPLEEFMSAFCRQNGISWTP